MVIEHKLIFDLGDIRHVRLGCAWTSPKTKEPCTGEAVVSLRAMDEIPNTCPVCGKEWLAKQNLAVELQLLKKMRSVLIAPSQVVNLRFEMDEMGMDE